MSGARASLRIGQAYEATTGERRATEHGSGLPARARALRPARGRRDARGDRAHSRLRRRHGARREPLVAGASRIRSTSSSSSGSSRPRPLGGKSTSRTPSPPASTSATRRRASGRRCSRRSRRFAASASGRISSSGTTSSTPSTVPGRGAVRLRGAAERRSSGAVHEPVRNGGAAARAARRVPDGLRRHGRLAVQEDLRPPPRPRRRLLDGAGGGVDRDHARGAQPGRAALPRARAAALGQLPGQRLRSGAALSRAAPGARAAARRRPLRRARRERDGAGGAVEARARDRGRVGARPRRLRPARRPRARIARVRARGGSPLRPGGRSAQRFRPRGRWRSSPPRSSSASTPRAPAPLLEPFV